LHRNSGLLEFGITASRKSGEPDLRCQTPRWRRRGCGCHPVSVRTVPL